MQRMIRQSEIKKFKRCRRSWLLGYQRKLSLITSDEASPAKLGTLVHGGLEVYYDETRPETITGYLDAQWAGLTERQRADKKIISRFGYARPMLLNYVKHVEDNGLDAAWEIVAVERVAEFPFGTILGEDIVVTAKLDLEVIEYDVPKLVDHKSVQSLDQAFLQVDDQLLTYALQRRDMEGVLVANALHNNLRRVKHTATSNPPYYSREPVTFNNRQLDNHRHHMTQVLTEMVTMYQYLEAGGDIHAAYPNPTKDCRWDCPFIGVCAMVDDGSDYQGFLDTYYEESATIDYLETEEDDE